MRWDAARAMGALGDPRAVERLMEMLHDPNVQVRLHAAAPHAATGEQRQQVLELARRKLLADDFPMRERAMEVIWAFTTPAAEEDL